MSNLRPRAALTSALLAATAVAGPVAAAHAVSGSAAADGSFAFTARVDIGAGERACSGVLIDPRWIVTAASCFADDPNQGYASVRAGKPAKAVTATIGRTDLTTTTGQVRDVVQLVPRSDRDVVLARLNKPVTGITPAKVATTAPAAGESLTVPGYGRTRTEWSPLKLHTGAFTVGAVQSDTLDITGQNGAAVCAGDTGGPAVRAVSGGYELVAVNSRSWQGGCFGQDAAETRTDAREVRLDNLGGWIDGTLGAVPVTDFNCDGVEDIAVADPEASVGGDAGVGLVRVVYGGGKGTAELQQDLDWVSGAAEAGDAFGSALDTVDHNQDGCTDLLVGTPGEDLDGGADAGMADVLYGAPGGFGTGTTKALHLEQGTGEGAIASSGSEAGDRMGHAVAAGETAAGEPYLVIGVPGEALGTIKKAGMAFYLRKGVNITVHQDKTDVPGAAETDDGFGTSIAANANHLAIGAPNEDIGGDAASGNLAVFSHTLHADGHPKPLFGLDQDLDNVSGGAEAGDEFGRSLALAEYRPAGASAATDSILAIGSPGEDLTVDGAAKTDAGRVVLFRVTAAGSGSELTEISQGTAADDISGTAESGDRTGETVTAINTAPRALSTTATMKLAVGVPGEAIGTAAKAGAVHTFSLLGAPGANDRWIEAGDGDGLPGIPSAGHQVGSSIHFTGTNLYVGLPDGPSTYGSLYALPLSNVTAGGTVAPVTAYQPGTGGLPAAGKAFGRAAR
ncbi:S1 family peptidase [Streptomyces griseorubiginosus]|uniref:S1 family peptidase n=1 Tax=Streptomyces griseorubiginosus TaxID=67304 RepID=UPI002E80FAE7|nr:trypsin-like serine protease [Streptomyces griseorubiginosus]WUB46193.1 S1 family peptidase [Streptomyces griseorubiginosus]WUB54714.1 S1 family peptidase [Streptomyces griseorubiginosus]